MKKMQSTLIYFETRK